MNFCHAKVFLACLALLIGILLPPCIKAQDCPVPEVLRQYYERDVRHLTLKRMLRFNAPELSEIVIPEHWQDTIWWGLASIFNSSSPERDTIFDLYCIHHEAYGTSNDNLISTELRIIPDTNAPWIDNWLAGNITTGDPFLDSLFQLYGFDEIEFSDLVDWYIAGTDQYLNLEPMAELLAAYPGIESAEVVYYPGIGGGDWITYDTYDDLQMFTFTLGVGTFSVGCQHQWSFEVYPCGVFNITSFGPALECEPSNCNISDVSSVNSFSEDQYSVFPNPVDEILWIVGLEGKVALSFEIYDLVGHVMMKGIFMNNAGVDISGLAEGMYVLRFADNQKRSGASLKFVIGG